MHSRFFPAVALALVLCAGAGVRRPAAAQLLTISGTPSLVITAAVPGAGLTPATDATSSYSLTTVGANQKLVARLLAPLPAGVTLKIQLSGTSSAGQVTLTTTDQDVVNAILIPGVYTGTITYTLSATIDAGPQPTSSPTVQFSLVNGP